MDTESLQILTGLLGCGVLLMVLWDVFEVIVLPRRVTRAWRLIVLLYRSTWFTWSLVARAIRHAKLREWWLSLYGPLSLPCSLAVWSGGAICGYALLYAAVRVPLSPLPAPTLGAYLYLSGVTFFTLGYGDLAPISGAGRALAVMESGTGLGLLAIVIGYLPVIYQAFSRRESLISLLDARAGSPPAAERLLLRHVRNHDALERLLGDWERWAAELLESHVSYPVLSYFRSQHNNESWLGALTTIMDTCVMVVAVVENGPCWQAELTFAMARHAVVDLAQIYDSPPLTNAADRLPREDMDALRARLEQGGFTLRALDVERIATLRRMYEPYVQALSGRLFLTVPPWCGPGEFVANWQTSAWERISTHTVQVALRDEQDDHDA